MVKLKAEEIKPDEELAYRMVRISGWDSPITTPIKATLPGAGRGLINEM